MAEINKIKVSELAEDKDGSGFWIFGYKEVNNRGESRRFSFDKLKKIVDDAAKSIQLQRRIAVAFERDMQLVPIGEAMTIEKVVGRNISGLSFCYAKEFSQGSIEKMNWRSLAMNTPIKMELNGEDDIILRVTNDGSNIGPGNYKLYSTVTLFAKAQK